MMVGNTIIPLLDEVKSVEPACHRVVAAVTKMIPPKSEVVVPVCLVNKVKDWGPGWGMLHSDDARFRDGLLIGKTLIDPSQDVLHLRVMNMTSGCQKIEKGSDLAKCELVETVVEKNVDTGKLS